MGTGERKVLHRPKPADYDIVSMSRPHKLMQFSKTYTRDFSIIMEETWAYALTDGFEKMYGLHNPYQPPTVHYMNEGVVEEWENPAAIQWIQDQLLAKSRNPSFIKKLVGAYKKRLRYFAPIWKRGYVITPFQLMQLCEHIREAMVYFISYYFPAVDDRTPKATRAFAMKVREADTFFYNCDQTIRKSFQKIYPSLRGLETVILRDEIFHPPSKRELIKRKQHWVVIPGRFSQIIALQNFAKAHREFRFDFKHVKSSQRSVKGQVAYGGIVKGEVTILRRQEEVKKVKAGVILVSAMTTPDFFPAMKRAAAFVTDEGGITCHAAIVARELKKPCVIGTKIATKVFKDGDWVEVDAEKGIVRKIA